MRYTSGMQKAVQDQLIQLNKHFYEAFASSFSTTRAKLQKGVKRLAETIPSEASVLDLGCGNGNFLKYLLSLGFSGNYMGLDFSSELLAVAKESNPSTREVNITFNEVDLTKPNWVKLLNNHRFDTITAFAVLHHIPNSELRHKLIEQVYSFLSPDGHFLFSVWQFNNSPRLCKRILSWNQIGLSKEDVDETDALLDWRAEIKNDQFGLRYCHLFSEEELTKLRISCQFVLEDHFLSDGREGNLALYQVWRKTIPN